MFSYCENNPINRIDPYGHEAISATLLFLAYLGTCIWCAGLVSLEQSTHFLSDTLTQLSENISACLRELQQSIENSFSKAKDRNYNHSTELHHIVAQRSINAYPARVVLDLVDIDVNDEDNLVPLKTGFHRSLHTSMYYYTVNEIIVVAYLLGGNGRDKQESNVKTALTGIKEFLRIMNFASPY